MPITGRLADIDRISFRLADIVYLFRGQTTRNASVAALGDTDSSCEGPDTKQRYRRRADSI